MAQITVSSLRVFFFTIVTSIVWTHSFSCRGKFDHDESWFIVYKLPKLSDYMDENVQDGVASYYMDSASSEWEYQSNPISGTEHAIYHTLKPLYDRYTDNDVSYLLYNDHPPRTGSSTNYGHAKGVLLFDGNLQKGFWMVHSLPRFPENPEPFGIYSWALNKRDENETSYGQIFMCISFEQAELTKIWEQVKSYKPRVYSRKGFQQFTDDIMFPPSSSNSITTGTSSKNKWKRVKKTAMKVKAHKPKKARARHRKTRVNSQTQNDDGFISIAKQHGHDVEIYSYIADRLKLTDVFAQTWRNGAGGKLPSCRGSTSRQGISVHNFQMQNVVKLKFPEVHGMSVEYATTKDHSKWAISNDNNRPWTCIGDLNRMESQKKRGGGFMCISSQSVRKAFYELIPKQNGYEPVLLNGAGCPTSNFGFVSDTNVNPA
ncbi:plancitoxin-1-like [Ptychodera flava]|uniref:plancitoxin-1-like n=1 Tax=Ptychodera flava TaxID=63121 RepID=UPI00396A6077